MPPAPLLCPSLISGWGLFGVCLPSPCNPFCLPTHSNTPFCQIAVAPVQALFLSHLGYSAHLGTQPTLYCPLPSTWPSPMGGSWSSDSTPPHLTPIPSNLCLQ